MTNFTHPDYPTWEPCSDKLKRAERKLSGLCPDCGLEADFYEQRTLENSVRVGKETETTCWDLTRCLHCSTVSKREQVFDIAADHLGDPRHLKYRTRQINENYKKITEKFRGAV